MRYTKGVFMKAENYSKYAILGLLTTGCHSGYEIKQLIDNSLNHFWKISYGQIYPNLKLIVQEGLATVLDTPQEGKPDKKEYYLTADGEAALQDWLRSPLQEIPFEKNEVLLKLFFSRHQSNEITTQQIRQYLEKLKERLTIYRSIEKMILEHSSTSADAKYWVFTLDYGKRTTQAGIDWCEYTISSLKEE
ncbi:DNA-binding PadR family transcriptional regulator [Bacillus luteolus]|nr:DNA-binding PadR family transcriptional regulator [Cytobacillus luteolus]